MKKQLFCFFLMVNEIKYFCRLFYCLSSVVIFTSFVSCLEMESFKIDTFLGYTVKVELSEMTSSLQWNQYSYIIFPEGYKKFCVISNYLWPSPLLFFSY